MDSGSVSLIFEVAVTSSILTDFASGLTRFSGTANEIVINNLLYEALRERDDLEFETREATTKSGEGFLAKVVSTKGLTGASNKSVQRPAGVPG